MEVISVIPECQRDTCLWTMVYDCKLRITVQTNLLLVANKRQENRSTTEGS